METSSHSDALLARLVRELVAEQRRGRRWNTVFRFALLGYLLLILFLYMPSGGLARFLGDVQPARHTALVSVNGVIAANQDANADQVVGGLRAAFEDDATAGVIVRINSPGGSPVQAGYIRDEMRRLREAHPDTPLYAVISDIAASGGYYVAVGADSIYADKASIVGSIGVLLNGFGFVDAMDKLGVERRLITAGSNKGFMDPFSPLKSTETNHMKNVLGVVHRQFIDVVRAGRGNRLTDNPKLFSGLVWTGEQGVELGLVDALGSASYVAREIVGVEKIVDYTPSPGRLDRLIDRLGLAFTGGVASTLGERMALR